MWFIHSIVATKHVKSISKATCVAGGVVVVVGWCSENIATKCISIATSTTKHSWFRTQLVLQIQKHFYEAELLYRRALEGSERTLGPDHSDTLNSVNNLGSLLQDRGQLDEAESLYRRALEGSERTLVLIAAFILTRFH